MTKVGEGIATLKWETKMITVLKKLKPNMWFKYKAIMKWVDTIKKREFVYQIRECCNDPALDKVYHT